MSALGLDDVDDSRGVVGYAPRQRRRADDETTIRPVLERLTRSEGRVPGPRLVHRTAVEDLAPPHQSVSGGAFPMVTRLAVAAGVLALVGAAAAGYLLPLSSNHAAPASAPSVTPTSLPKPVQTVSIQRPAEAEPAARIVKDDARVPQPAAVPMSQANASAEAAPPASLGPAAGDPSIAPLKTWAAMPAEPSGWSTPSDQTAATEVQASAGDAAPSGSAVKPEVDVQAHKTAPVHHARHAARHRVTHHRRRHTAQAVPRQADQPAQPADVQPSPAQPVKKLPLQAAIDRMFGNSAGAAQQPQR